METGTGQGVFQRHGGQLLVSPTDPRREPTLGKNWLRQTVSFSSFSPCEELYLLLEVFDQAAGDAEPLADGDSLGLLARVVRRRRHVQGALRPLPSNRRRQLRHGPVVSVYLTSGRESGDAINVNNQNTNI